MSFHIIVAYTWNHFVFGDMHVVVIIVIVL